MSKQLEKKTAGNCSGQKLSDLELLNSQVLELMKLTNGSRVAALKLLLQSSFSKPLIGRIVDRHNSERAIFSVGSL